MLLTHIAYAQTGGHWLDVFAQPNGVKGSVYAMVHDAHGNLIVGGSFEQVGEVLARNIAMWNGQRWMPVGEGFNGTVFALTLSETGQLYAGGNFTEGNGNPISRIARWDGTNWHALGNGVSNFIASNPAAVYAMAFNEAGVLFVGGDFSRAGSGEASGIATWDGSTWQEFGSGVRGFGCLDLRLDNVYAVHFDKDNNLVIGGLFEEAGSITANGIARWVDDTWQALGDGVKVSRCGSVRTITSYEGALYIGGSFSLNANEDVTDLAMWDGVAWQSLGQGVGGNPASVQILHAHATGLFVGGRFSEAGSTPANSVAKWMGGTWTSLGDGVGNGTTQLYAIESNGSLVYVGGEFVRTAGGVPVEGLGLWEITSGTSVELLPRSETTISVYPHPIEGRGTIELAQDEAGWYTVQITNLLGQVMFEQQRWRHVGQSWLFNWPEETYPSGIYVLCVYSPQRKHERLIVLID